VVVNLHRWVLQQMDNREELRRLISIIEQGSANSTVADAIDDIRLFTSTASSLVNRLDARMKSAAAQRAEAGDTKLKKKKSKSRMMSLPLSSPPPKRTRVQSGRTNQGINQKNRTSTGMPTATATAVSQSDYERLKPTRPVPPRAPV